MSISHRLIVPGRSVTYTTWRPSALGLVLLKISMSILDSPLQSRAKQQGHRVDDKYIPDTFRRVEAGKSGFGKKCWGPDLV